MITEKGPEMIDEDSQKWFVKEEIQDLAKLGGEFLRKTLLSSMDVIKEVKENLPKEASHLLNKGKEELLRGLTQETAKQLLQFTVEKFFNLACQHRLEFSIRIRRNKKKSTPLKKSSHLKNSILKRKSKQK